MTAPSYPIFEGKIIKPQSPSFPWKYSKCRSFFLQTCTHTKGSLKSHICNSIYKSINNMIKSIKFPNRVNRFHFKIAEV